MWLLPSRDRTISLQRFFAAYRKTVVDGQPGRILVNDADYRFIYDQYDALQTYVLPRGWVLRRFFEDTPGLKIEKMLAELLAQENPPPWIGILQDDLVPHTPHWDRSLIEGITRKKAHIVTSGGGLNPQRMDGAILFSRELVQAAGWIFPPSMGYLYVDDLWETIAKEMPKGFWLKMPEIVVEHRHASRNNAIDGTHLKTYNEDTWRSNSAMWEAFKRDELTETIARIKNKLYPPSVS